MFCVNKFIERKSSFFSVVCCSVVVDEIAENWVSNTPRSCFEVLFESHLPLFGNEALKTLKFSQTSALSRFQNEIQRLGTICIKHFNRNFTFMKKTFWRQPKRDFECRFEDDVLLSQKCKLANGILKLLSSLMLDEERNSGKDRESGLQRAQGGQSGLHRFRRKINFMPSEFIKDSLFEGGGGRRGLSR